jgi:hypothetical protein
METRRRGKGNPPGAHPCVLHDNNHHRPVESFASSHQRVGCGRRFDGNGPNYVLALPPERVSSTAIAGAMQRGSSSTKPTLLT